MESGVIFADSSFWIAATLRGDDRHALAAQLADVFAGQLVATSNLVVGETWSFLRRRDTHRTAMSWLQRLRSAAGVRIHRVEPDMEDEAWSWLGAHDERSYSFVDATSFALMRRLQLREALAFDGDFTAAGFLELRA